MSRSHHASRWDKSNKSGHSAWEKKRWYRKLGRRVPKDQIPIIKNFFRGNEPGHY